MNADEKLKESLYNELLNSFDYSTKNSQQVDKNKDNKKNAN